MKSIEARIDWALAEIAKAPYPWRPSVEKQLRYCSEVLQGTATPERLEHLNMAYVVLRELDGDAGELGSAVAEVQSELQQKFLSYAAKVRLGIQKR